MMRSLASLGLMAAIACIAALSGAVAAPPQIAFRPLDVEFPADEALYPALGPGGPSPDAVNANCLACHSASMVLTQPRLTKAEWTAEVAKMRTVYKAPIDPADDAAIIAWLTALSDSRPGS